MWKDVNLLCLPPVRDQFLLYELAGSKEARHATLVCSEPFVNVRLRRQHERGPASFRIAAFGRDVPELRSATFLASAAMRHHVVAGAKQLEVILVIDDWHTMLFQFPQN